MDSAAVGIGAIVYLIFAIVFFCLAIAWIVFPFIVISKANKMIKQQAEMVNCLAQLLHVSNKSERHLEVTQKSVAQVAPAQANFYYSTEGRQEGPLTADDLRNLRQAGLINDDTLVVREGDSEWKQYRHCLALNR
jgi:hypothetical protein